MRIGNWETVRLFLWGEEPSTKQEKKLLLKIDWFILSYCCLMVRLYRVHGPSRTHVSSNSTLQIVRQHIHFRLITTVLGRPVAMVTYRVFYVLVVFQIGQNLTWNNVQ